MWSNKTRMRVLSGAAVAALALSLVACSSGTPEESAAPELTGDPIKVGFLNRETGSTGQNLSQQSGGAKAAVEYINNELGGVDGHPVEIEVCASDGTPAMAQTCAQKMVEYAPHFVSTGTMYGMDVVYPVLEAAGIPVIGNFQPTSAVDFSVPTARYWNGGTLAVISGAVGYVLEHMDVDKVGMLIFNIPAGQAAIPLVKTPLEAAGKDVTIIEVPTTATDMLAPYTAFEEAGVDVVLAMVTDQQCVALAQAAQSQNSDMPFVTQPACYSEEIVAQAGGAMTGWVASFYTPDPASEDPEAEIFRTAMEKYAPDVPIDQMSASGFGGILTTYYEVLQNVAYDELSMDTLLASADEADQAFMGPALNCGAVEAFSSICAASTRWYRVLEDGSLEDATDGEWVNAFDFLG